MIVGLVARNGVGKTLGAVHLYVLECWKIGRPVASNIALRPEKLGYPRDYYVPVSTMDQLLHLGVQCQFCDDPSYGVVQAEGDQPASSTTKREHDLERDELGQCAKAAGSITGNRPCMLLLDEITSVLPSRDFANVPPQLQRMTQQLRKPQVSPVVWTAPSYARADKLLREVCTHIVEASVIMPRLTSKRASAFAWPQHRFFRYRIYDAADYEAAFGDAPDLAALLDPEPPRPQSRRYLLGARARANAFAAYDTREGVALLDHIECSTCGGKFARKSCKCGTDHPKGTPKASVVVPAKPPGAPARPVRALA